MACDVVVGCAKSIFLLVASFVLGERERKRKESKRKKERKREREKERKEERKKERKKEITFHT